MGHGVTASTIEIGVSVSDNSTAAAAGAMGDPTAKSPDFWKPVEATINYLNAHGGVLGRKIVPVVYTIRQANYLSASGREQMSQEACAQWTQDHHVAAIVVGAGVYPRSMLDCAQRADTPYLATTPMVSPMADSAFSKYGRTYYALNWMNAKPHAQTLCNGLWDQGFFGKDARVGILTYDDPWVREDVDETLKPCLKSHGVNVVSEVRYPDYVQSSWSNYVLQFQSAQVTHVVWPLVGFGGFPFDFFANAAESQQFRPLYGLGSDAYPAFLSGRAPADQIHNIRGVGVSPYIDVAQPTPLSPNAQLCFQILKGAGSSLLDIQSVGLVYCEALLFVKTVFDRATALNTSGFQASVATLGNGFDDPTATNGASSFSSTGHDGAAVVRDFAYSAANDKIVYTSPPRPVSR